MITSKRKYEHVEIAMNENVQYVKSAGFEQAMLVHNALPELDFDKINLKTEFLGKMLSAPFLIEAMTGGYLKGGKINKGLAEIAEKTGIAFGLGSQRSMLENPSLKNTYYVRDVAPSIPIIANIGVYQLKKYGFEKIENMVSAVDGNALAIHLNPLQEIIQLEGDKDFSGLIDTITRTCERLNVPVIVKETGAGIGSSVAKILKNTGVKYIDVAGAGGTSWSTIEYARKGGIPGFVDWGIPTLACIIANKGTVPLIASGGVRNGIDSAKAIALGAEITGAAYPFLIAFSKGKLENEINLWKDQLKACMFLTGSKDVCALKNAKITVSSEMTKLAMEI